jgi:hypothetical protein
MYNYAKILREKTGWLGVYEGEITEDLLLVNLVICILKWVILKTRNYIKYNKSIYDSNFIQISIYV